MANGHPPRVLLADDFPDLLIAVGRLLAKDCDVVGSVADGTALLEAVALLQPDVAVVDLNIPAVNGLEACRRITRTNPHIKVILLTAERDAGIKQAALAAGACAFIEKHAVADDLLPAIHRACAG